MSHAGPDSGRDDEGTAGGTASLLFDQQVDFNAAQAGRTLNVLSDRKGRPAVQAVGRSPYLQSVHVGGADHLLGRIVPVRIEQGNQNSLKDSLVEDALKQPRSTSVA